MERVGRMSRGDEFGGWRESIQVTSLGVRFSYMSKERAFTGMEEG